jgi:hypothetical protein
VEGSAAYGEAQAEGEGSGLAAVGRHRATGKVAAVDTVEGWSRAEMELVQRVAQKIGGRH